MVYVVASASLEGWIRTDPQAYASHGERVWKTASEARAWRDENEKDMLVYRVFADWNKDTRVVDKYKDVRVLAETFKMELVTEENGK